MDPVEESVRDHRQIYNAVRDGGPDTGAASMREHIERTSLQLREIVFDPKCNISSSARQHELP
nr:FCD domain-containing protein [Pseudonocardia sp. H11422]